MYCPFCGKKLEANLPNCPHCGSRLSGTQNDPQSTSGGVSRPIQPAITEESANIRNSPVLDRFPSILGDLNPHTTLFVEWTFFQAGKALVYDPALQPVAAFVPILRNAGLDLGLQNTAGEMAFYLRKIDRTKYQVMQRDVPAGHIEEHLVKNIVYYYDSLQNRTLKTNFGQFVSRRSISRPTDDKTLARLYTTKKKEVPRDFDRQHFYTISLKDLTIERVPLLALVLYILLRYL